MQVGQAPMQRPNALATRRREYFLCTVPAYDDCSPDEDFSAHYGQPVYVCAM